ncbi:sugar transferase [Agromyces sp. NPDC058484]|uniref:sugar transferase n=1 Tax=Agromyces sp. NPDC058484 TaxID=3346524 RepID=UPI00365210DD
MNSRLLYRPIKRSLDFVFALAILIFLLPLLGLICGLVALQLGRPVLFRQERPGRHGRTFSLYKFRTMIPVDPGSGLIEDADRLTAFGVWLRTTSLDELPSLWNVVRGDMSFIGPRPLLVRYLPLYTREQARRHEVRPGVTGLAQVNGRNALQWDQKFRLDVLYVDRYSFLLDLRIALATVGSVVRRSGISAEGHVTAPEFNGNEDQ